MLNELKNKLKNRDMFGSASMLRYKQEESYTTWTGLFITLATYGVIIYLIYQQFQQSFTRDKVEYSLKIKKQRIPANFSLKSDQINLAVHLLETSLGDRISYVDIQTRNHRYENSTGWTSKIIPMQTCQKKLWNKTQDIEFIFKDYEGSNWLCLQNDIDIELAGKWTTQYESYFELVVAPCGSLYNKTNCANPQQMIDFWNKRPLKQIKIYAQTPLIEPEEAKPITYQIKDYDLRFDDQIGVTRQFQVAEFQITTDKSTTPFKKMETITGAFIQQKVQSFPRKTTQKFYSSAIFSKSSNRYTYQRKFKKIDQTLSYAGGLIGIVIAFLFLMPPYTQLAFQLSLGNRILKDDDSKPVKAPMNPFYFVLFNIYNFVKYFCSCWENKTFDLIDKCSQTIQNEINVLYLIKRLNTLQKLMYSSEKITQKDIGFQRISFSEANDKKQKICKDQKDQKEIQIIDIGLSQQNQSQSKNIIRIQDEFSNITRKNFTEHKKQIHISVTKNYQTQIKNKLKSVNLSQQQHKVNLQRILKEKQKIIPQKHEKQVK